jgi:hypothetical protein
MIDVVLSDHGIGYLASAGAVAPPDLPEDILAEKKA